MNPRDTFTWLGLDASLRAFGWALFVDDGEVHSCQLYRAGVWETERDPKLKKKKGTKTKKPGVMADNARRMNEIGEQLAQLAQSEHPVAIFIESLAVPFMKPTAPGERRAPATSLVTVQALGRIRGIVDGIALVLGVPVFEVHSQTIKVAMTGRRDAEKEDVARRAVQLYPAVRNFLPEGEIDDNVTDAVAVGHIGEQHEVIAAHRRRRAAGPDLFDAAPKSMAEQLDEQLEKKRRAEETTEQRIARMATPAVVYAPSAIRGGAPVPISNDPLRAAALRTTNLGDLTGTKFGEQLKAAARPPKGNRGRLTVEPPAPKPGPLELPTQEQLAKWWDGE